MVILPLLYHSVPVLLVQVRALALVREVETDGRVERMHGQLVVHAGPVLPAGDKKLARVWARVLVRVRVEGEGVHG